MHRGMSKYLRKKHNGKKFHDVLAACVAINRNIVELECVELYFTKNKKGYIEWGSKKMNNSDTRISVNVNHDLFFKTLIGIC